MTGACVLRFTAETHPMWCLHEIRLLHLNVSNFIEDWRNVSCTTETSYSLDPCVNRARFLQASKLPSFYRTSNKLKFFDDGYNSTYRGSWLFANSYTKRSEDRLHVEVETTSSPLNYDRPLDLNKLLCFLCLYQLSPAILRSNLFRDSIWIEFAKSAATKLLHQIATFLNYVFYNNLPQTVLSLDKIHKMSPAKCIARKIQDI